MTKLDAGEWVAAASTGKQQKKLGAQLDEPGMSDLRLAIVKLVRKKGVDLAEGAELWPGKKLLRRAQGREGSARVRKNPIARDEDFECVHCGEQVAAHGRTARDHCPYCLFSRHVDIVPGDRAETCEGLLRPVSVSLRQGHPQLAYQCDLCGARRTNQAILDGEIPDSWELIMLISARSGHG